MSPAAPQTMVATLLMYQVPFDGRKTAMSAVPSPLKSPATGISPAAPQAVLPPPARNQRPALGRNTPRSLTPSRLKSFGMRWPVIDPACAIVAVVEELGPETVSRPTLAVRLGLAVNE